MMTDALFEPEPGLIQIDELAGKSAQQRLTIRQRAALANGQHPLSLQFGHMPLNADTERRCGNCRWLGQNPWGYFKCRFGSDVRVSRGAGTDVRKKWPACGDHEYEEAS